jgi:hypothetical protein
MPTEFSTRTSLSLHVASNVKPMSPPMHWQVERTCQVSRVVPPTAIKMFRVVCSTTTRRREGVAPSKMQRSSLQRRPPHSSGLFVCMRVDSRRLVNCAQRPAVTPIDICHAALPIVVSVSLASSGISRCVSVGGARSMRLNRQAPVLVDNKFVFGWNSTGRTAAGVTGSAGTAAHRLNNPASAMVDQWNNLYVCDSKNSRVQRWLPGSTNGTTVAGRQDGTAGSSLSALNEPFDLSVDDSGGVYIADTSNHRVVYWSNGSPIGRLVAGNGELKTKNVLWITMKAR